MTVTVFIGICDFLSWHIDCRWTRILLENSAQFTLFALKNLYCYCPFLTRCEALYISISLFSNFQHLEKCNFISFVGLRSSFHGQISNENKLMSTNIFDLTKTLSRNWRKNTFNGFNRSYASLRKIKQIKILRFHISFFYLHLK